MKNTNRHASDEAAADRRPTRETIRNTPSLSAMTDEQLDRLSFEARVLSALRTGDQTRKAKFKAATVMGCSEATVYRKLRLFKEACNALVLAKGTYGFAWRSNLAPRTEEIVQRNLAMFLRKHGGKRVKTLVELVVADCIKECVEPPSKRTIRRRFERLPERVKYAHKHGSQAAADKFDVNKGSTPPARFPLERIQCDHTPSDLWVVSEEGRLALSRLTVTLVVDEFSRVIVGIHVTFGHPSVDELAEAMAIACMPKEAWLKARGIQNVDWPWHGVPTSIFVDRGVDFTSTDFARGCMKWDIELAHRMQPHHGGIVERAIRNVNEFSIELPGNTRFSKAPRREDRIDPSKTAHLTLNEFLGELVRYCVEVYAHTPHSTLGMTPAQKWAEGVHEWGEPRQVDDPERFYLDFLKAERPTLQKYGVRISYLEYADRKLQPLLNTRLSKQVYVKRDPGDVARAFVEDPRDGSYIEVWNEVTRGHDITVAEWEEARRGLRAELKKVGSRELNLTAAGILGYLRTERNRRSESLSGAATSSKLLRAATKKAEHRKTIRKRCAERLSRKIKPDPVLPAQSVIDLADLRQF